MASNKIRMSGMVSGMDTESLITALTSNQKTKVDKAKGEQKRERADPVEHIQQQDRPDSAVAVITAGEIRDLCPARKEQRCQDHENEDITYNQ